MEVSSGTGRNLAFYPLQNMTELIQTDSSVPMLQVALEKYKQLRIPLAVQFTRIDAHELLYPDDSFDTVVDTFGLCSHHDPIKALKEMARVVKPFGKILLLEHGRSDYEWLNNALDKTALSHAEKWGCWWNRDILSLLKEAGLEPVQVTRAHFGTTYQIICTKPK